MSDVDLIDSLLTRAILASLAAADLLVKERADDLQVDSKASPTDVVTIMDKRCEQLLVEQLLFGREDDGVLGEEGGERSGTSGVRWILDPIDGTVNYMYRLPEWSVSIGLEIDGRVVAGVVNCPALDEIYVAAEGRGAALHKSGVQRKLKVNPAPTLDKALVATGFGYDVDRRRAQSAVVQQLIPQVRDIRRAGAASVDLCAVAAGRVDGYYERGLKLWDHAAGGLIAREAGAKVGGVRGAEEGENLLIAAPPELFDNLDSLLSELNADRD